MKELQNLNESKKGLIIHHWDTDGLCSAALLLRFFEKNSPKIKISTLSPTINNYFLTSLEYQKIDETDYDFIITCDINFPEEVVMKLENIKPGKVFVFDHHKQEPIKGVFYYNKRYPSCTLVLREYLGLKHDIVTALGAIGDKEEKIMQDKIMWPIISKDIERHKISFAEILHLRNLIDSCYISDNYDDMTDVISLLKIDPFLILDDVNLRNNLSKVNKEMASLINKPADLEIDNIVMGFELNTVLNLLSHTTRELSRKYADKIVLTWQFKNKQTNIYVRRRDLNFDISGLIKWARLKGCNCGGKEEVVGIIYSGNFKDIKDELLIELKNLYAK